jgi:type III secretory pathway component EscV
LGNASGGKLEGKRMAFDAEMKLGLIQPTKERNDETT